MGLKINPRRDGAALGVKRHIEIPPSVNCGIAARQRAQFFITEGAQKIQRLPALHLRCGGKVNCAQPFAVHRHHQQALAFFRARKAQCLLNWSKSESTVGGLAYFLLEKRLGHVKAARHKNNYESTKNKADNLQKHFHCL